jgi:signal transduction histidine kinase
VERLRHQVSDEPFKTMIEVSALLVGASDKNSVMTDVLRTICTGLGWDEGAVWELTSGGYLQCTSFWQSARVLDQQFSTATRVLKVERGVGVPGRVWESRESLWAADVRQLEERSPRYMAAVADGLHCAFAFPLIQGGDIVGVMEFFRITPSAPDYRLMSVMLTLGAQVSALMFWARERVALNQREREATEANRLKDEFLAVVSHELRTPLNGIYGWCQLIESGGGEEDLVQGLEVIKRNTKALDRIISDLLDVSRITGGEFVVDMKPCDLASILWKTVASMRPEFEKKEIQLECDTADSGIEVLGDSQRIGQVFWNLLSNALKFTEAGGAVSVTGTVSRGNYVVNVRDSGEGIDAAFLPHLFQHFRQQKSVLYRTHDGLGLGLTIVRHIVQLHKGTVSVSSQGPGQGSTFTVSFPIRAECQQRVHAPVGV